MGKAELILDESGLKDVARTVAHTLSSGDIVYLIGPLGAGKSCFARSVILELCHGVTDVPSPSFTLIQSYEAQEFELHHLDLYRLTDPEEISALGLDDLLKGGVLLIEWPDLLDGLGFEPTIRLELSHIDMLDKRKLIIETPFNLPYDK